MSSFVVGEVLNKSLTEHGSRLVLIVLADSAQKDGVSFLSQPLIAELARIDERTVRDAIDAAVELGELQVRKAQRGRRRINVYRVTVGTVMDYAVDYERLPFKLTEPFDERQILPAVDPRPEESSSDDRKISPHSPSSSDLEPEVEPLSDVKIVYDYWRKCRGKTRANYDTISAARRKKIVSRLREFTREQLLTALEGVGADPWAERHLHDDLTVVFRNREQVDRFLGFAESAPAPSRRFGRGVTTAEVLDHARVSQASDNGHVDGAGKSLLENLASGRRKELEAA